MCHPENFGFKKVSFWYKCNTSLIKQTVVNIMLNKYKSIVILSAFIFWNSSLNTDTTKIDNILHVRVLFSVME